MDSQVVPTRGDGGDGGDVPNPTPAREERVLSRSEKVVCFRGGVADRNIAPITPIGPGKQSQNTPGKSA